MYLFTSFAEIYPPQLTKLCEFPFKTNSKPFVFFGFHYKFKNTTSTTLKIVSIKKQHILVISTWKCWWFDV